MAGLCFFFEENDVDVWSGRHIDMDAWNYAIKIAGDIDNVIIINKTDQELLPFDSSINIEIVNEMPHLDGIVTQIICPCDAPEKEKTSLWDFDHNTDWYVLGSANGWNNNYFGEKLVYIPQNGIAATHSIFVNTVIMFHRYNTINKK